MIVDQKSLDVRPIADRLFAKVSQEGSDEVAGEKVTWCNELVNHVVEFKNGFPVSDIANSDLDFHKEIMRANDVLASMDARLIPGGAHPWMNPQNETKLWPFGSKEIYEAYNRIFNCSGHGWSNLQSSHINMSFSTDEEFGKLHAASRAVLPLVPMLYASTPFLDSKIQPYLSSRLYYYMENQKIIPEITGECIPEPVWDLQSYKKEILGKIYKAVEKHDKTGVLLEDWVNSRGAIPKLDTGRIEIRLADNQECPLADISLSLFIIKIIKNIIEERWCSLKDTRALSTTALKSSLMMAIRNAENSVIENRDFLSAFDISESSVTGRKLLEKIFLDLEFNKDEARHKSALEKIISRGSLASQLIKFAGVEPSRNDLRSMLDDLGQCLLTNSLYTARK
jgi:hypothetical protein